MPTTFSTNFESPTDLTMFDSDTGSVLNDATGGRTLPRNMKAFIDGVGANATKTLSQAGIHLTCYFLLPPLSAEGMNLGQPVRIVSNGGSENDFELDIRLVDGPWVEMRAQIGGTDTGWRRLGAYNDAGYNKLEMAGLEGGNGWARVNGKLLAPAKALTESGGFTGLTIGYDGDPDFSQWGGNFIRFDDIVVSDVVPFVAGISTGEMDTRISEIESGGNVSWTAPMLQLLTEIRDNLQYFRTKEETGGGINTAPGVGPP